MSCAPIAPRPRGLHLGRRAAAKRGHGPASRGYGAGPCRPRVRGPINQPVVAEVVPTHRPIAVRGPLFRGKQPLFSSPNGHDLRTFSVQTPRAHGPISETTMPTPKRHALTILGAFEEARSELIGKAVVLTDGKAGTVEGVWLDEFHGLRIAIRGHDGNWPVSTIKFAQTG